jgi:hypothetical protein
MTAHELAHMIHNPLFGDCEELKDAYDYVVEIAKASENPAAVLTAVHVLMNTLAIELERME